MFITTITIIFCCLQILTPPCRCLVAVELSNPDGHSYKPYAKDKLYIIPNVPVKVPVSYLPIPVGALLDHRRYWSGPDKKKIERQTVFENEKDLYLKTKIRDLIEQVLNDIGIVITDIEEWSEKYKNDKHYRVGYILNMIQKAKNIQDELFDVSLKHREHVLSTVNVMKLLELLVASNLDITNLLAQLEDFEHDKKQEEKVVVPESPKVPERPSAKVEAES